MKKRMALVLAVVITLASLLGGCSSNTASSAAVPSVSESKASATPQSSAPKAEDVIWPTKSAVQILVPFAAGGNSDLCARVFAEALSKKTGGDFIVVNMTEGGGAVCYNTIMNSDADGSTLGWVTPSWFTSYLGGTHSCNPKEDFSLIAMAPLLSPVYVMVNNKSPFNTMEEFVNYNKENPGKLTFGMQMGSASNYYAESMAQNCGIKLKYVETGSGDAVRITALLGGNIDATVVNGAQAQQYYEANELKLLAALSPPGSAAPDIMKKIPTLKECGYENITVESVNFLYGPKMDEALVKKINAAFTDIFNDPEVQKTLLGMNQEMQLISSEKTPDTFEKLFESYRGIANSLGVLAAGR